MSSTQACVSNKPCLYTKVLNNAPLTSKLHNWEANNIVKKVAKIALMVFLTIPTLLIDGTVYLYNQVKTRVFSKKVENATASNKTDSSKEASKKETSSAKTSNESSKSDTSKETSESAKKDAVKTKKKVKEQMGWFRFYVLFGWTGLI